MGSAPPYLHGMSERSANPERRDGETTAAAAGLTYVSEERPGWSRRRRGRGFSYHQADGSLITDGSARERIDALAIPPAWGAVWICPLADGHIQATGRDEAGRKQYIYHAAWRDARDAAKFRGLVDFGNALPSIRRRVRSDLRAAPLTRRRVTAAVVRLMDETLVRVGNAKYARGNGTYGVTTLRTKHVRLRGGDIRLAFDAKGGERRTLRLHDPEVAEVIRSSKEAPGYELFHYDAGGGVVRTVTSDDVNAYLRDLTGADVTAKDFRTSGGTTLAASGLDAFLEGGDVGSVDDREHGLSAAIERAAEALGNTPAVCRASYVHPALVASWLDGTFAARFAEALEEARARRVRELRLHETATLRFLEATPR